MSRRLVIAIDCDDVLLPTATAIIEDYNARFATALKLEHMYTPARMETWGTDNADVAIERVNEFLRSKEHATLAPHPEAVDAIKQLAAEHELHLITGRADFLQDVTQAMLDAYFPGCFTSVEHTNFIVSSTDTAVKRTKGEVCQAICADILIDDHVVHGKSGLECGLEKIIVFGDFPWNRNEELDKGMVRCHDWPGVLSEVEKSAA